MTRSRAIFVALALVLACSDNQPAFDADPQVILTHVTTLGSEGSPGALASWPSSIARDSKGRYYVTVPWAGEEPPFVYDSSGQFLQRLGSVGDGPGEFRRPHVVVVSEGDTVRVFDQWAGRLTTIHSLQTVRTDEGVPRVASAASIGSKIAVGNAGYPGWSLSFLNPRGSVEQSFGTESPSPVPNDEDRRILRALAASPEGTLWSARKYYSYELTQFDSSGTVINRLTPSSDWFAPYDLMVLPTHDQRPNPTVNGLLADQGGVIWVLGAAASPDWHAGLGDAREVEGQSIVEILDISKVYDGVVEAIDSSDGTVLGRVTTDSPYLLSIGSGLFASARETELGWVLVDVFRVSL